MTLKPIRLAAFMLSVALSVTMAWPAFAAETVGIDYAYYNPVSLILRDKGWLDQDLAARNLSAKWVLSLGSNKALEFLNGSSVDFASTAAAASLISRANGNPVKEIYVYSRPEWTGLVTRGGSPIKSIADLKGKRVAVTRGTDPFIFLLRALKDANLTDHDLTLVPLQHGDGRAALDRGDVDAWAGLDPYMAQAELESGDQIVFHDRALNSAGVLNIRDDYASAHADIVALVLKDYERARLYALDHPQEVIDALTKAANLTEAVASRQMSRVDLSNPRIGPTESASVAAAAEVLKSTGIIPADTEVASVTAALIDPHFSQQFAER